VRDERDDEDDEDDPQQPSDDVAPHRVRLLVLRVPVSPTRPEPGPSGSGLRCTGRRSRPVQRTVLPRSGGTAGSAGGPSFPHCPSSQLLYASDSGSTLFVTAM